MRIIRGKYGRRRFAVPGNITARPTTDFARENIFNVIENLIDLEGVEALDLFAGTGAISFEFLSRECAHVTAVEKAPTQWRFIEKVAGELKDNNITVVHGDAWKYVASCRQKFDVIFADPPYNMPDFADFPLRILESGMLKDNTVVIIEHSKAHDFSHLPGFIDHRAYGAVNFSIFRGAGGETDCI